MTILTAQQLRLLLDMPFKRVAVDNVGSIVLSSEAGHQYIFTLVDYTTRYPEAVPLKKITTEAVAEATRYLALT